MADDKIFVGRKPELKQFTKVLEESKGQAILVVGQPGMGKTLLINKMAELAENHPDLKCGWVRYEVTEDHSVDSRLEIMTQDAYEAADNPSKWWGGDDIGKKQWIALYKILESIPKTGRVFEAIRKLALSLKHEPSKDIQKQFIKKLRTITGMMGDNGRAIFIVDPEKYMKPKSDGAWALMIKNLPEKVKFIFAQRPEDVLIRSETFGALKNVVRIPGKELDVLSEEDVDDLVMYRKAYLHCSVPDFRKILSCYKGHPYAVGAALNLVEAKTKLEELPTRPEPIEFARVQWQKVCEKSKEAIRLMKAYAILKVGVPDEVVKVVGNLDTDALQHILADKYCSSLLRLEGHGKRIYHAILADFILGQIGKDEKKEYHSRAVKIYHKKLQRAKEKQTKPDALAAMRLSDHVLAVEGKKAFVYTFINVCTPPLLNLGLLDAAINLSEQVLGVVEENSETKAAILGNLGIIYQTRSDLDKAKDMHNKSLVMAEKLGLQEQMSDQYSNLGLIYITKGALNKAEEMFLESLKINLELVRLDGLASNFGNLGLIYLTKSELDKAEEMFHNVLNFEESLGRQDSIANAYGNLGLIYRKRGDLDKAEEMHNKTLEIEKQMGNKGGMARAYGNLGLIYENQGDFDKAEEMYNKALEINKKLGRFEGMAKQYGNLGVIYFDRGDLDKAEEMHNKALEINKKLGRLEGMANQYGNLGLIYQTRGELDKAEEMHLKSLEIDKKLGHLEGMASDYGNLGSVYYIGGELDKAEVMQKKSLEISDKLGLKEVMLNTYSNLLGIYIYRGELNKAEEMYNKALEIAQEIGKWEKLLRICDYMRKTFQTRGQFDKVEEMYNKVLEIEEHIGDKEGMVCDYSNLGLIYHMRGELDKAEQMHKNALEIEKKLGLLEEMAREYLNLGAIYKTRGELDKSEEMHKKSLEIAGKLELKSVTASDYVNLGGIFKERGDIEKAREYWEKALELFKKIGMPRELEMVQRMIEGLKR